MLTGGLMFKFKSRACERELERKEALEHITHAVHVQLCEELQDIATLALNEINEHTDREHLFLNAVAIRRGIDAVLAKGGDVFGAELKMEDRATRSGAILAQAARNMAILSGSLNNSNTRGDISLGLGFEREAFG
ncbi:MAG: hypothetical protein COC03_00005 [Robiginitomaculum sp.]|nr:MAG: hypothetical protein COC03_00005 [Robiginitomaculum sp.]